MALNREQIVTASLAIADREGPQALGIRHVARELGVTPMALYRYVESKEELLEALRASLWDRLDFTTRRGMSWRNELRGVARAFRRLVRDHPAAPALMLGGSGESGSERRICDILLGSFRRAGFGAERAEILYQQFSHFVLALVRLDAHGNGRAEDGFELGLELFLGGVAAVRRRERHA